MFRNLVVVFVVLVGCSTLAPSAAAQQQAGVHVGFDTEFEAVVIGGNVRFPMDVIEDFAVIGNPSFDYFFVDAPQGVTSTIAQLNATGLHPFEWEDHEEITPYAGAGLGLRYESYSVDTQQTTTSDPDVTDIDPVINLVGGANYELNDRMTPFGHLRLSLGGGGSTIALIVGALFEL